MTPERDRETCDEFDEMRPARLDVEEHRTADLKDAQAHSNEQLQKRFDAQLTRTIKAAVPSAVHLYELQFKEEVSCGWVHGAARWPQQGHSPHR